MTVRVFVLDDHEVVRAGLRRVLREQDDLFLVGEASTGAEALARIPCTRPDVAVLDALLPDMTGVQVCQQIRARCPDVRCLILTAFADDKMLFNAIRAGASGYLLKQTVSHALVEAIRAIGAGRSVLDPDVTGTVLDQVRFAPPEEDDPLERLTETERRIMKLIVEGCTNKQIAQSLYLAEKTVKNYVSNVLTKLGMQRRSQVAAYAARLPNRVA